MRKLRGFTLVELLVVIGIIALLVSILLPALNSAKRQAELVKCASCLREIGNANAMYVNENKGWEVPGWLRSYYTISYTNQTPKYDDFGPQYWYQFLSKYVTRARMGTAGVTNAQAQQAEESVFWGCPAFARYGAAGTAGGFNKTQPGYGFNCWPEYTANYPKPFGPPNTIGDALPGNPAGLDAQAVSILQCQNGTSLTPGAQNWKAITAGRWYKAGQYTNASERALVADSQFWSMETQAAPLNGTFPGQKFFDPVNAWYTPYNGQSLVDVYRHGKFPPVDTVGSSGKYQPNGDKVSANVLFCDGHVATLVDRASIYKAARMRYPG